MLALVVDDSKVVRMVSRKIMESLNFEVMEAEDGKVALEQCKQATPDVILLDWNMPVMNGIEFLEAFRQFKEYADSKVIFCTTENDMSNIQRAMTSGANEYVMKPFDEVIIKGKLEQLSII